MSNEKRPSTGKQVNISAITTDATASDAVDVAGWDYVLIAVTAASGTGDVTYKIQGTIEYGGDKMDIPAASDGTTTTITQTAAGTYPVTVNVAGFDEVHLTSIDVETGSYSLNAKVKPFNEGT